MSSSRALRLVDSLEVIGVPELSQRILGATMVPLSMLKLSQNALNLYPHSLPLLPPTPTKIKKFCFHMQFEYKMKIVLKYLHGTVLPGSSWIPQGLSRDNAAFSLNSNPSLGQNLSQASTYKFIRFP